MIVVTDTSVALNLGWPQHESLLEELYEEVLAPGEVRREFVRKTGCDPRFRGLQFPAFIKVAEPDTIPAVLSMNSRLDPGEAAAMALALERGVRNVLIR